MEDALRSTRPIPTILLSSAFVSTVLGGGGPRAAAIAQPEALSAPRPGSPADSTLATALLAIEGEPLTLEGAVSSALDHASELERAQASLREARGLTRSERGRFDPEIFAEALGSGEELPSASPFAGADVIENEQIATATGARMRLLLGTEIEASLRTTRSETNSAFAALRPQYDAAGLLELRQPLLRGFGPSARSGLDAADRLEDAALARYEEARASVREQVEETYWDLYAAERDLAVGRLIRDRAIALLGETERRAGAGIVGPGNVAAARVFVSEQAQTVLDREESLDEVSDRLASLIGRRPAHGLSRFRPSDAPPFQGPLEDADALVAHALEANRSVRAAEMVAASYRARERGARWDALPSLDLVGSLGGNALSGEGREVIFGSDTLRTELSGGYGDVFTQVSERRYPTWSAGVQLTVPLGLRTGRADRDRARAAADAADAEALALRRAVEEEVRASHRELANGAARLEAARQGVEASQEQVRIGLIEYRSGITTAFEVVRLGADLAAAEQRYSQALVRTAKAAARLRYLTYAAYPPAGSGSRGGSE